MARWLIITGLILVAAGIILYFAPGLFRWFGKLPGDIRIERENFSLHIPIVSMLILSVVISVIIWLFRR